MYTVPKHTDRKCIQVYQKEHRLYKDRYANVFIHSIQK